MIRVHIICEGQTEETFVNEVIAPHLQAKSIYPQVALIGKPGHKGGNVKFERLFPDVRNRLTGDAAAYCTTFFDFYGLPEGFPGKAEAGRLPTAAGKAQCVREHITQKLADRIDEAALRRFIPYVQMHEFEGLLFSDPEKFAEGIFQPALAARFRSIRDSFPSPESINDSPVTAPSKRVQGLVKGYEKPTHGVLAAIRIGLPKIRSECPIFDAWLTQLEALRATES